MSSIHFNAIFCGVDRAFQRFYGGDYSRFENRVIWTVTTPVCEVSAHVDFVLNPKDPDKWMIENGIRGGFADLGRDRGIALIRRHRGGFSYTSQIKSYSDPIEDSLKTDMLRAALTSHDHEWIYERLEALAKDWGEEIMKEVV